MTDWIENTMLDAEQNISKQDLDLFRLVDTPEEAVEYIEDFFTTHSLTRTSNSLKDFIFTVEK